MYSSATPSLCDIYLHQQVHKEMKSVWINHVNGSLCGQTFTFKPFLQKAAEERRKTRWWWCSVTWTWAHDGGYLELNAGTHWKRNRTQVSWRRESLKLVAEGSDAASTVSTGCISSLETNHYAVNYTTEYSVMFGVHLFHFS